MVEAIVKDQKKVLPCSVLLNGEYGVKDLFVGVCVLVPKSKLEKSSSFFQNFSLSKIPIFYDNREFTI